MTGSRRGRRGEAERCLHISRFIYSQEPSGGVSSPNPQTRQVTGQVSLVGLARTMDTFHSFWRNFHPKFRYLNAIHKKTGRGGWAAKGVPCARFLVCPIINNTITKILFSVAFFHYWPHETSPGYSREDVYSCFFDVSKFLNFSHESIDLTSTGVKQSLYRS